MPVPPMPPLLPAIWMMREPITESLSSLRQAPTGRAPRLRRPKLSSRLASDQNGPIDVSLSEMFPRRLGTPAVCVFLGNSLERDGTATADRCAIRARISATLYWKREAGVFPQSAPGGGAPSTP